MHTQTHTLGLKRTHKPRQTRTQNTNTERQTQLPRNRARTRDLSIDVCVFCVAILPFGTSQPYSSEYRTMGEKTIFENLSIIPALVDFSLNFFSFHPSTFHSSLSPRSRCICARELYSCWSLFTIRVVCAFIQSTLDRRARSSSSRGCPGFCAKRFTEFCSRFDWFWSRSWYLCGHITITKRKPHKYPTTPSHSLSALFAMSNILKSIACGICVCVCQCATHTQHRCGSRRRSTRAKCLATSSRGVMGQNWWQTMYDGRMLTAHKFPCASHLCLFAPVR